MEIKFILLDLFCGSGGAAMGYHRALDESNTPHEIIGIDINSMPNYPFTFIQGDALEYAYAHGKDYNFIHASPPCQRYSRMQHIHKNQEKHPDLIDPTRKILSHIHKPYVIENVIGAPLFDYFMLCGTMFNLPIAKHRLFETSMKISVSSMYCDHSNIYDPYHGGEQARGERYKLAKAIGVTWNMTRPEVREAIPPAFTRFIMKQYLKGVKAND